MCTPFNLRSVGKYPTGQQCCRCLASCADQDLSIAFELFRRHLPRVVRLYKFIHEIWNWRMVLQTLVDLLLHVVI